MALSVAILANWTEPCPEIAEINGVVEDITPKALTKDEMIVYNQLGPVYKKIYLYVLNDEERGRVVFHVKRGLDPYNSINTIISVEQRKASRSNIKNGLSPAERSGALFNKPSKVLGFIEN